MYPSVFVCVCVLSVLKFAECRVFWAVVGVVGRQSICICICVCVLSVLKFAECGVFWAVVGVVGRQSLEKVDVVRTLGPSKQRLRA